MKGLLTPAEFAVKAHLEFRRLVMRPDFSCLGAKAAFNENAYDFAVFGEMATKRATARLSEKLFDFTRSPIMNENEFSSFVAVFQGPLDLTEREFETCLWLQLRQLHDADRYDWDPRVSSDPNDPHFSFSFARQAFYVIGMHAHSSRDARRFPWPTLVFNPHEQFEKLRTDKKWKRMQDAIRKRELALQGSINPMLSDFGEESEARQYSGRAVSEDWKTPIPVAAECPFEH
jgi:FPC/CPF motif-containing protein YcgG